MFLIIYLGITLALCMVVNCTLKRKGLWWPIMFACFFWPVLLLGVLLERIAAWNHYRYLRKIGA